jgi:hypothetical protein
MHVQPAPALTAQRTSVQIAANVHNPPFVTAQDFNRTSFCSCGENRDCSA